MSDIDLHRSKYIAVWNKFRILFHEGFKAFNARYKYFKDEDTSPAINEYIDSLEWMNPFDKANSYEIPDEFIDPETNTKFDENRTKELRMRVMAFNSALSYCFGINSETGYQRLYPYIGETYDEFIIIAQNELSKILLDIKQIIKFSPPEGRSIVDSLFYFKYTSYERECKRYINMLKRFDDIDDENSPDIPDLSTPLPERTPLDILKAVYDITGDSIDGYRTFVNALHEIICGDYDRNLVKVMSERESEQHFKLSNANEVSRFCSHVASYFAENKWLDTNLGRFFAQYPPNIVPNAIPTKQIMRVWTSLKETSDRLKNAECSSVNALNFEVFIHSFLVKKRKMPYPKDYLNSLLAISRTSDAEKINKAIGKIKDGKDGVILNTTWSQSIQRNKEKIKGRGLLGTVKST